MKPKPPISSETSYSISCTCQHSTCRHYTCHKSTCRHDTCSPDACTRSRRPPSGDSKCPGCSRQRRLQSRPHPLHKVPTCPVLKPKPVYQYMPCS